MSDHVAKPPSPPPSPSDLPFRPNLNTAQGVQDALKAAEAALRQMVWRTDPKAPPEAVEAFWGAGPGDGWSATVVGWTPQLRDGSLKTGEVRYDGAVVNASLGLVMRMTPELTKLTVELAHSQIVAEAAR